MQTKSISRVEISFMNIHPNRNTISQRQHTSNQNEHKFTETTHIQPTGTQIHRDNRNPTKIFNEHKFTETTHVQPTGTQIHRENTHPTKQNWVGRWFQTLMELEGWKVGSILSGSGTTYGYLVPVPLTPVVNWTQKINTEISNITRPKGVSAVEK